MLKPIDHRIRTSSTPHRLAWHRLLAEVRFANHLQRLELLPRLQNASRQILTAIRADPDDITLLRLLLKLHLAGEEPLLRQPATIACARRLVNRRADSSRDLLLAAQVVMSSGLANNQVDLWREGVRIARKAHTLAGGSAALLRTDPLAVDDRQARAGAGAA